MAVQKIHGFIPRPQYLGAHAFAWRSDDGLQGGIQIGWDENGVPVVDTDFELVLVPLSAESLVEGKSLDGLLDRLAEGRK